MSRFFLPNIQFFFCLFVWFFFFYLDLPVFGLLGLRGLQNHVKVKVKTYKISYIYSNQANFQALKMQVIITIRNAMYSMSCHGIEELSPVIFFSFHCSLS